MQVISVITNLSYYREDSYINAIQIPITYPIMPQFLWPRREGGNQTGTNYKATFDLRSWDLPLVLHVPTSWWQVCSWSLPHMHVQRWDLAWIRMGNHPHRRQTRNHCASELALNILQVMSWAGGVYLIYTPRPGSDIPQLASFIKILSYLKK